MTPLLSASAVCKRFGGVHAVSNVSLDIDKGEIRAIIGPNGSGKSTFINLLTGIYRPDSGNILFGDQPITRLAPHLIARLGMSRTFQNLRLFKEMSVLDNVMIGYGCKSAERLWDCIARTSRFVREEARTHKAAGDACVRAGVGAFVHSQAGALSYGQQRRVEIARALVTEPALLVLDEPVAGMNTSEAKELGQSLRELRSHGLTVLLIEHNVRFVMSLADRITVFDYGKKLFEGSPDEVQREPRVIEAYLGVAHGLPAS